MAAHAQAFIDQGISFNLHYRKDLPSFNVNKLMENIIQAYQSGMKTWLYYLRRDDVTHRANTHYIEDRISAEDNVDDDNNQNMVCTREEGCTSCSS